MAVVRTFGSPTAPKERYKQIEVNGETWDVYSEIPALAAQHASAFAKQMQKALVDDVDEKGKVIMRKDGTPQKTYDFELLDNDELTAAIYEAVPHLLPSATSKEILARMKGDKAPILGEALVAEIVFWIALGMPADVIEQTKADSGKAKSGQKTSTASGPTKTRSPKSRAS